MKGCTLAAVFLVLPVIACTMSSKLMPRHDKFALEKEVKRAQEWYEMNKNAMVKFLFYPTDFCPKKLEYFVESKGVLIRHLSDNNDDFAKSFLTYHQEINKNELISQEAIQAFAASISEKECCYILNNSFHRPIDQMLDLAIALELLSRYKYAERQLLDLLLPSLITKTTRVRTPREQALFGTFDAPSEEYLRVVTECLLSRHARSDKSLKYLSGYFTDMAFAYKREGMQKIIFSSQLATARFYYYTANSDSISATMQLTENQQKGNVLLFKIVPFMFSDKNIQTLLLNHSVCPEVLSLVFALKYHDPLVYKRVGLPVERNCGTYSEVISTIQLPKNPTKVLWTGVYRSILWTHPELWADVDPLLGITAQQPAPLSPPEHILSFDPNIVMVTACDLLLRTMLLRTLTKSAIFQSKLPVIETVYKYVTQHHVLKEIPAKAVPTRPDTVPTHSGVALPVHENGVPAVFQTLASDEFMDDNSSTSSNDLLSLTSKEKSKEINELILGVLEKSKNTVSKRYSEDLGHEPVESVCNSDMDKEEFEYITNITARLCTFINKLWSMSNEEAIESFNNMLPPRTSNFYDLLREFLKTFLGMVAVFNSALDDHKEFAKYVVDVIPLKLFATFPSDLWRGPFLAAFKEKRE